MELNSIVLLAQWGIVLLFVLFHFFLGFKRGTSKSLYYFVVSLLMTVVTLFIVSMFTIRWFYTPTSLIAQVKGLWEGFPTEYEAYLSDPGVGAVIFALVDLVVKIVAFFILYPIVKYALTLIFFKLIWTRLIEPRLQKNVKGKKRILLVNGQTKSYDLVPVGVRSGKKKRLSSRFIGGGIGAVRGFLVAFIFLLPIMVIASMVSPLEPTTTNPQASTEVAYAETGSNAEKVNELLDALRDFNELGVGSFARQFKVNEQNLDKYIFDKVFTTKIKEQGKTTELNLADEIEAFVGVGRFLIDRGILDDSFNYEDISKEDLEDIKAMLDGVKRSRLVDAVIPIATRVLVTEYLSEELGFDFYNSTDSKRALDAFDQIDWDSEIDRLYDVVEIALEFASVKDLVQYSKDPKALLNLTPEQGAQVADAIEALSKLEMLVLANAGVDYARSNEDALSFIDWLPENERQDYINNRTAFMTSDLKYLQNQIGKLSGVVRAVFSEEYSGDLDLAYIVDNITNLDVLLSDDPVYSAWINEVLLAVIDLDLVIQAMPIAVDYSIYTFLGEDFEETLVEKLATELDGTGWKGELTNIADVYRQVLSLGLKGLFADDVDMIDAVDALLEEMAKSDEGLSAIKEITTSIFDGSDAINRALEILAPTLVDKFVEDEELATLIKDGLGVNPTTGETNFNYGKEVNDVLSVVEVFYQFATIGTFTNQALGVNEMVDVLAGFGGLTTTQFNTMVTKLTNLQMVTRLNGDILSYVKEAMALDFLYVPNQVELKKDLTTILNVAYEAGKFANEEVSKGVLAEDINFAPLLSNENFRSYLTVTGQNRYSNLLMANIAYNLMDLQQNEQMFIDFVEIPANLMSKSPESPEWKSELNRIITGVLDLGSVVGTNEDITLSINGIKAIADNPMGLPLSVVTNFKDQTVTNNAFAQLESSLIFRASVPKVVNYFSDALDEVIPGYVLSLPQTVVDENGLKVGILSELIAKTALVADELNQQLSYYSIEDALEVKDITEYLAAFNYMNVETLDAFGRIALLEGLVGEALQNTAVINYIYDQLATIDLPVDIITGSLVFDKAYTNGVLNAGEISKLLVGAHSLQVPDVLITDFTVEILLDYVKTIDNAKIDAVFASKLLHQLITNVIDNPNLETYAIDLANEELAKMVAQEELLAGLTVDFEALYAVIKEIKDSNNLFDHVEIKNLLNAFNALDLNTIDEIANFELSMITDFYFKEIDGKNVYHYISSSYILRGVATAIVQDNGILSWAYDLAEDELNPLLADFDMVLSDIVLKSDVTTLEIDPQYLDSKGYFEQADFYDLMVAAASLKLHNIIGENITLTTDDIIAYVYGLNNQAFYNNEKDALGFIYRSRYVRALLQSVIENEQVEQTVVDLLNEQLASVSTQLDYNFRNLTVADINLSYDLVDESSMRSLISAVENAGIYSVDQLTSIKTIADVSSLLRLDQSDDILYALLDTKLVKFAINTVLVNDIWSTYVTDLVNDLLANVDMINLELSQDLFELDPSLFTNGVIDTVHLVDLVKALYATGYDIDVELTPEFINNMVKQTMVAGEMVTRIDQVLNSEILYTYIDKVFADMSIKQALADLVMEQALAQGFELDIDYQLLNLPEIALDENGRLKKTEITSLLNAFASLELTTFDEFSEFSKLSYITTKVNETAVVDYLLASDIVYYVVGGLLASAENRDSLASSLTTLLSDELGITYEVSPQLFTFTEFKYDLINIEEDYYGFFKREDIKQLIKSGLRIDYTSLSFATTDDIFYLVDLLLEAGNDNVRNVDYIFQSNIIVALFDKLLNVEGNPQTDLNVLYALLANKYLPEISTELADLEVTESLFNFSHIQDAKGVFEYKHLVSILEFAQIVDINNIDQQFAFDLFDKDKNFNGAKDIDDLFESKLVHSLVTNVLNDTGIRSFAVNYANDLIADQNIDVLNDINLDVEAYLVALSQLNDAEGLFDYNQFVRVRNVLSAINVNSVDDFNHVDVNSLTALANMNIEGNDYLSYIAHTDLVRFLVDVTLKQDGLYTYLSNLIETELGVTVDLSNLTVDGYDDSNGHLQAAVLYDLLLAGAAIDIRSILDNNITPAYINKFLEQPVISYTTDRIGLIFGSKIITDLIKEVVESPEVEQYLLDLVNEQLSSLSVDLNVSIRNLRSSDINLTYDLFNEQAVRNMILTFVHLDVLSFDQLTSIKTVEDVAKLVKLETRESILYEVFNLPVVNYVLDVVLLSDIWTNAVAELVNRELTNLGLATELDQSFFALDQSLIVNGSVDTVHLVSLVKAFYALGFDVNSNFDMALVNNLVNEVVINNQSQARIDYILNAEILYTYIDKLMNEMVIKEAIAEFITTQSAELGFEVAVDAASVVAPIQALDENGRLKKSEIKAVVKAVAALGLTSFDDFNNFSDLTYISNKVNTTNVVEELLQSDWIYLVLGGYINDTNTMKELANTLTTLLWDNLAIDFTFSHEMFMFRDLKYDLFVTDELYNGYIKREEIKQLIVSGLRIDWMNQSYQTTADIQALAKLMLKSEADGKRNIDVILSSKVLMALFDRVLNVEANQSLGLDELYALIANKYVKDIDSSLENLVVTKDLFNIRGVSNANGTLSTDEITYLVELVNIIDFNNIDAQLAFDIFRNDLNNNGFEDFDEIFRSKIVLSLVTNVIDEPGVRSVLLDIIETEFNKIDLGRFNGIQIDFEAYLLALTEVKTTDGFFKYQDLRGLYNVLYEMNVRHVEDFNSIDLEFLTSFSSRKIYGVNYLEYIASIDLLRFMFDVTFKQDGLYQFASDYLFDEFQMFYQPADLRIDGYSETNGRLSVDALTDLLLAASAVEIKPIMDQMVTPEFLVNLLEKQNANVDKDRLGLIFGSEIINGLIEKLVNHESTSQKLANLINEQVPQFADQLGVSIRTITTADLGISYELVNEASLRSLVVAFNKLGITEFNDMRQLKTVESYADLFGVEQSSDLLVEALSTPLVNHVLNQVLLSDIWTTMVADLVNSKVLANYGVEVDQSLFEINRDLFVYNGKLLPTDIAEFVLSVYAVGFDVDKTFSTDTIKSWQEVMMLAGESKERFYQVLDSEIIYEYINRFTQSSDVMSVLKAVIEQEAAKQNINVTLDESQMELPQYLLDNTSRILKSELMQYVVVFNTLDLSGFNELSDMKLLYSKLHSTNVVEELFDTELVYNLVLESHANDELLTRAANEINKLATDELGVNPNLTKDFFLFNDVKYGLYDAGLLKKEDLVQLVLSLTIVDWLDVNFANPQEIITALNEEKELVVNIDYMMESNILVAIFDRILNFNENSVVVDFAVNYINKFASENADFANLNVTGSIFNIHADAFDANGVLKASEITSIVRAAGLINWSILVDFNTFANLVGRNDNANLYDDFDELFVSKFVHSLVSNLLTDSNVKSYLVSKVNEIQETIVVDESFLTFDSSVMNGQLVKVSELRNAVIAVDTIGLDTFTSGNAISLDTFTSLLGRNLVGSKDDLDRVLDSGIIYVLLTKVFEMDELSTLANEQLTQALVKVFDTFVVNPPQDALGTSGIELNRFSKAEIRALMNSLSLINLGTDLQSISPDMFTSLIGQNLVGTTDDLDRVLQSKYLVDKLDMLLQADGFIDLLAGDLFDPQLFSLPTVATETVGTRTRLKAIELRRLFVALDAIGITDFANPNVGISTLTGLTQTELDQVLASSYLYTFVDLVMKNQTDITIPADAFETSGDYTGMIKLAEINNLFDALNVLGVTDVASVTVDTVTVAKLQELHDLNSSIIDQIISDEIENALTTVPTASYDGIRISRTEVQALIDALDVLAIASLSDPISVSTITTADLQTLHDMNSAIVNRLLSEGIINSVGATNVRDEAYSLTSDVDGLGNKLDLDYAEVGKVILALGDLNVDLSTGIDPQTLTPATIKLAVNRESLIVNRLVSNQVISNVSSVPTSSYEVGSTKDVTKEELINIMNALIALNADLSTTINVDSINYTTFNALLAINSRLVDRLVSESILDSNTIDVPASALAVSGDTEFDSVNPGRDILRYELQRLAWTMETLNVSLTAGVDPNTVTRANLNTLVNYNSRIIDRIISTRVIEIVVDVPTSSYVDTSKLDITNGELKNIVNTLTILGITNLSIGINTASLTQAQLNSLYLLDSRLVDRMISKQLIASTVITVPTEALAVSTDSNFDSANPGKDIKRSELLGLIDAMAIMGITDITVSMDAQAITINQLEQLDALNSVIVDRIISTAIISAMDIPTNAYTLQDEHLKKSEITGMIEALVIIADNDKNKTMAELDLTTILPANLTTAKLDSLLNTQSLIVYRLVSTGIKASSIDTPESIATALDVNYDANAVGKDIKVTELEGLVEAMDILGVTNVGDIAGSITLAHLQTLSDTDVATLVAAPNTIVYYLVSNALINEIDGAVLAAMPETNFTDSTRTRFTRSAIVTYFEGI